MKILLSGEGGQGVQTIAKILSQCCFKSGHQVSYMPHYGVEMRMGISLAYIRIGEEIIDPKFSKADFLLIMAIRDLEKVKKFIDKKTTIINLLDIHRYLAENNLSSKAANILALAIMVKNLQLFEIKIANNLVRELIVEELGHKKDLPENLKAFELGLQIDSQLYSMTLPDHLEAKNLPLIQSDNKKDFWQFPHLCKSCGICLEHCPVKALSWSKDKFSYISRPLPQVDIAKCLACGICQQVCPDCAIRVIKK